MASLTYNFIKKVDPEYRKHLILMPSGRKMDEKLCPTTRQVCNEIYCMIWDDHTSQCKMGYTQKTKKQDLSKIIKEYEDLF